jgi:formate hydrogenlyase transcriptional activator
MAARTSWTSEASGVNHTGSFAIEETVSARVAPVRSELRGGLPKIIKNRFGQVIGRSPALRAVLEQVKHVAPTYSAVLIQGETGTGKALIAQAIYNSGSRRGRPFVKLSCAAIPLELLESELFGHERGAFTGAIAFNRGTMQFKTKVK